MEIGAHEEVHQGEGRGTERGDGSAGVRAVLPTWLVSRVSRWP